MSSTHEILETHTCLQHPTSVSDNYRLNDTIVIIPVYTIATLLFRSYESNVDHLCPILHIPTLWSLIKNFYLQINQRESVLPSQAALLLSIFAISAYFYQPFDNSAVATTKQDAIHLSKIWSRGALDVLDYSRRNASGTLEDVQASILMSFVACHLNGFSVRLLSTTSGPQGMYFTHPNHVNVRPPKDYTDDDLVLYEKNGPIIRPQPTSMASFLERLRLAHLYREMTDAVPLETSKLMRMPSEQIIALDKKLQEFISNLPFFFKLDVESRGRSKPLETMYPKIPVSRCFITTEAYSKRCNLHQRFLHRQSVNPRYAYSRQVCLELARAIVQVYKDLREHNSPSTVTELMVMAVHFTHLALVVMAMHLCFNRDEADEAEIKAEVKEAGLANV